MPINTPSTLTFTLLILATSLSVSAGEAVSGLNGKLGYSYGNFDSDDGQNVSGTVSLPLSENFGAQVDAIYSRIDGIDFYGAGGHIFWRDWDHGLIGLAFGGVDSTDVKAGEVGVETEYYFSAVTLGAYAGVSTIKYDTTSPFIDTDKTEPFGTVYLGFYPLPDLLLRPSFTRKLNNNQYRLEVEYALPHQNLSLTADGMVADHDFQQFQFGIRYYFGGSKSLKARHRQDDPVDIVSGSLTSIGTYGAEYIQKAERYLQKLRSAPAFSGSGTLGGSLVIAGSGTLGGSGGISGSNTYNGITKVGSGSGSLTLAPGAVLFSSEGGIINPGTFNLIGGGSVMFDGTTLTLVP